MAPAILLILLAGLQPEAPYPISDPSVDSIVARTHDSRATYSLYTWNRITLPGDEPIEEWAAEFHQGSMHRVETPRDRVVADCAAMTGTHLNVDTGEKASGAWVAETACGIAMNSKVTASEYLGRTDGEFGLVDQILLDRVDGSRTYDVAQNGALVGETIADLDGNLVLTNAAVELLETVPPGDIFSEDSLETSVVPDEYKNDPGPQIPAPRPACTGL